MSLKMKAIILLKILESLESAINLWFMPLSMNLELTLYVKLSKMLQNNKNYIVYVNTEIEYQFKITEDLCNGWKRLSFLCLLSGHPSQRFGNEAC
jgi:hypothetical protein